MTSTPSSLRGVDHVLALASTARSPSPARCRRRRAAARPGASRAALHQRREVREAADLAVRAARPARSRGSVNACASRVPGRMPKCLSSASPTRCGGLPAASPTPRFTLGSRKWTGRSCAWQSVKCSRLTLPNARHVVERGAGRRASSAARASSGRPAAAAAERASELARKSRRVSDAASTGVRSLVDRRLRIHQQRDHVLDLLLRSGCRCGRSAACSSTRVNACAL